MAKRDSSGAAGVGAKRDDQELEPFYDRHATDADEKAKIATDTSQRKAACLRDGDTKTKQKRMMVSRDRICTSASCGRVYT